MQAERLPLLFVTLALLTAALASLIRIQRLRAADLTVPGGLQTGMWSFIAGTAVALALLFVAVT